MKNKLYLWYANHSLQIMIWIQLLTVAALMVVSWGSPIFQWVVILSVLDSLLSILQSNAFGAWYKSRVDAAERMYKDATENMHATYDENIKSYEKSVKAFMEAGGQV